MILRWREAATAAIAACVIAAPTAFADDDDDKPIQRELRFIERGDSLTIAAVAGKPSPLSTLFDIDAYNALANGVASVVVLRIWIYPRDSTDAVAFVAHERSVAYDPWDEVYNLQLSGKKFKEKQQAEALKRMTSIDDLVVAKLAALPRGQVYQLAMQVELNPVSKELRAEVRRWMSQGTGGGLDRGGAFFGSFASVFVNPKLPEADRVLRIRSQPFYRPKQ